MYVHMNTFHVFVGLLSLREAAMGAPSELINPSHFCTVTLHGGVMKGNPPTAPKNDDRFQLSLSSRSPPHGRRGVQVQSGHISGVPTNVSRKKKKITSFSQASKTINFFHSPNAKARFTFKSPRDACIAFHFIVQTSKYCRFMITLFTEAILLYLVHNF